jgi:hypothetical protein
MSLNIDPTTLDDSQLTALAIIAPDVAQAERLRRRAFKSSSDAITALRQAHLELATIIAGNRQWKTAKKVVGTGILDVIERLLLTEGLPKGEAPKLPGVGDES